MGCTVELIGGQIIAFDDSTQCPGDHPGLVQFVGNGLNGKNNLFPDRAFWPKEKFDCHATSGVIHRITATAQERASPARIKQIEILEIPLLPHGD